MPNPRQDRPRASQPELLGGKKMIESIVFGIFMVIFITVFMTVIRKMAKVHLKEWAAVNGYELLDCDYRHVKIGPYHRQQFFVGKGNFLIFRIEVRMRDGETKTGWARVGDYFLGTLSDNVDVVWD